MQKGPGPFEYYFLITNIYILFIFCFHFYKNRHWFLRTYIIGKCLQLAGIFLLEFGKAKVFLPDIPSLFFIIGFPFEIFGLISYDGYFNKKRFRIFLYVSIFLFIVNLILISQHVRGTIIIVSTVFFYSYASVILLSKKDKSRFRYLIGITFMAYSLISAIVGIISISHMAFQPVLPPPVPGVVPPHYNLRDSYDSVLYFVMIVSSIGYLVILKEQDEIALDKAYEQISKENTGLKRLDEEKNKFFSIIAHDLKGPIGTLAKLTEVLVESKNKLQRDDYEKWLALINQTATRTYTLLNNLLQWARSESGILSPNPEVIDVKELLNEVIRLMQAFSQYKNIQITENCPNDILIFADKEMIRTIIRNLISNAIKFTHEKGIIEVNVKQDKDVVISISDTGVGMSSEVVKNLFALDSKHNTLGTNSEEGTGIGLKLTHEFVVKNNGRIWAESKEGIGSTFFVVLPRK